MIKVCSEIRLMGKNGVWTCKISQWNVAAKGEERMGGWLDLFLRRRRRWTAAGHRRQGFIRFSGLNWRADECSLFIYLTRESVVQNRPTRCPTEVAGEEYEQFLWAFQHGAGRNRPHRFYPFASFSGVCEAPSGVTSTSFSCWWVKRLA